MWVIDPATGEATFTPDPGLDKDPTPVPFVVTTQAGEPVAKGVASVDYPDVDNPPAGAGAQGAPVSVVPVFDASTVASSTTFAGVDPALQPQGAVVSDDGKSLSVPGEGTWVIDPVTGALTFTPLPEFTGDPQPVAFTASDAAGSGAGHSDGQLSRRAR
ncbi:hypothetical protein JT358_00385 [Micrococcales bacterium 31B]|nr:hypothetical protein [Micrococcales bacterium 31B]